MPDWGNPWGSSWGTVGARMQTTTQDALRTAFIAQIQAITPSHGRHADCPWAPVEQTGDVPSGRLRQFYVQFGFPEDDPDDSIWGDGFTKRCTVQVWANYSGLAEQEPELLVPDDGRQIYLRLESRLDPQIPGLTSVTYLGFVPEADESGYVWGSHDFDIRYLASNTP